MNYKKLDAALAMAINEVEDSQESNLVVFIHVNQPLDYSAVALLERLGVRDVTDSRELFTATISANTVSELSLQPWVTVIKLSQKLSFMKSRN